MSTRSDTGDRVPRHEGGWRVRPLGDAAFVVSGAAGLDPAGNAKVVEVARRVKAAGIAGVRDVVPTHSAVTVYVDPLRADLDTLPRTLQRWAETSRARDADPREITVGVDYGGPGGPDLTAVARFAGCSVDEVVRRHASGRYRVFMLGFLPGFAYLGVVDPSIAMPRREAPRLAVPARSVGIAGRQTGVYPSTAPGGWQLIGTADLEPFTLDPEPSCLFRPGDLVRFEPRSVEGA